MFWYKKEWGAVNPRVNNETIHAVKLNDSSVYLGKEFCYNMSCKNVKCDLGERLSDSMGKIDILSLHLEHKINSAPKFVYGKLRWDLTIYLIFFQKLA